MSCTSSTAASTEDGLAGRGRSGCTAGPSESRRGHRGLDRDSPEPGARQAPLATGQGRRAWRRKGYRTPSRPRYVHRMHCRTGGDLLFEGRGILALLRTSHLSLGAGNSGASMRTGPQTYSAGAGVRHRDSEAEPLAGFASRKLTAFFNLGPGDVRNLAFLYFATFIMRAAAFAGVAVMQDVMHSLDPLWRGVLFAVHPLAEIATVGYLGALCDRIGRKRILVFAHLVTAAAVFLFILSIGVTPSVRPYLVAVFFAMFGIGAAAKVASTLAMINDHSNRSNRAQLMAFFALVTFAGLAAGFEAAFLALHPFAVADSIVLAAGVLGATLSAIMVQSLVRETPFTPELQRGPTTLLRTAH